MRTKNFHLNHENKTQIKSFKERLYANNHFVLNFHDLKNMIYAKWFKKKSNFDKKYLSIVVEFISSKLINDVMMKSLYFARNSHFMKRYIRNYKLQQCFHCWNYEHYIHQCFVEKLKCKKCAKFYNKKNYYNKFNKCAICNNKHIVIANSCSRRKNKFKKLNKIKNV